LQRFSQHASGSGVLVFEDRFATVAAVHCVADPPEYLTFNLNDYFVSDPLSLIRIKVLGSRIELRNAVRRHVSHGYSCFATQKRHVPENVG